MKNKFLHFVSVVFIVTTFMLVFNCKDSNKPKEIAVTGVTLKSGITLEFIGDTETLTATVEPADATNQEVTWDSDDDDVATVNDEGLVTAIGEGDCVITVTTVDGGHKAICIVTVPEQPPIFFPVTGVSIDPTDVTLNVNQTLQLNAIVEPTHATNQDVTWSSSDSRIASVDASSGLLRAVSGGEAVITVTTVNGAYTATCQVKVQVAVVNVSFRLNVVEMIVGQRQIMAATIFPLDATNRNVSWNSNNEAIAEINEDGLVTAKSIGESVITVTTENGGKKATIIVKVLAVPPVSEFVQTYGSKFIVNGEEIVFNGIGFWGGNGASPPNTWTAAMYQRAKDIGFNCVRLYMGWNFWEETTGGTSNNGANNVFTGTYKSAAFTWLDNQISYAKANGIRLILNIHHTPKASSISDREFFIDEDRQTRLANLWKVIAERYKDEPTIVGFDIINEPTVRVVNAGGPNVNYNCIGTPYLGYFENYREIIQNIADAIREVNMNHTIIVERLWIDPGSCSNCWWFGLNDQRDCWQNYDGKYNFPDIVDPANNYAYTYHCYEPNTYCHQTANSNTMNDPGWRSASYPSGQTARYNEGPNGVPPWKFCKEYLDYAYTIPLNYIWNVKNVPAFVGEMGQHWGNYVGTRGGAQYMEDVYDILLKRYKISQSFHVYYVEEFSTRTEHVPHWKKAFGTE